MEGRWPAAGVPGAGGGSAGRHPPPARRVCRVSPVRRRAGPGRGIALLVGAVLAGSALAVPPSHGQAQGTDEGRRPAVMGPPPVFGSGTPAPGEQGPKPAPVPGQPPAPVSPAVQAGADDMKTDPKTPATEQDATPSVAGGPGRQSPPPHAAPATEPERPVVIAYEPAVLRVFECPREAIARMIASAVAEGQFSEALELEREVLVLCRDRQAILKELVQSELDLAAALQKSATARAKEALSLETARREADSRIKAARAAILESVREEVERVADARVEAAKADAARDADERVEAAKLEAAQEAEARIEEARAEAARAGERPATTLAQPADEPPEYGWFAVMGSGGDLRAAVTDGEAVWRVRAGDELPGGVRVVAVEARPPGVVVQGWTSDRLPYRPGTSR